MSPGNCIFSGLQIRNRLAALFGCVAAAVLAIIVDQLLGSSRPASRGSAAPALPEMRERLARERSVTLFIS